MLCERSYALFIPTVYLVHPTLHVVGCGTLCPPLLLTVDDGVPVTGGGVRAHGSVAELNNTKVHICWEQFNIKLCYKLITL